MNINDILTEWREVKKKRETLAQEENPLKTRQVELEQAIVRYGELHGLTKFGDDHVTVSLKEKPVFKRLGPWAEFVEWAVKHNSTHVIQRRITDEQIAELVISGQGPPDEIGTIETFTKATIRRK